MTLAQELVLHPAHVEPRDVVGVQPGGVHGIIKHNTLIKSGVWGYGTWLLLLLLLLHQSIFLHFVHHHSLLVVLLGENARADGHGLRFQGAAHALHHNVIVSVSVLQRSPWTLTILLSIDSAEPWINVAWGGMTRNLGGLRDQQMMLVELLKAAHCRHSQGIPSINIGALSVNALWRLVLHLHPGILFDELLLLMNELIHLFFQLLYLTAKAVFL